MTEQDIEGASRAHQVLLDRLDDDDPPGLTDEHISRMSLLPGWTVGHVLAHLTHNASSLEWLIVEAEAGRIAKQYPGGQAQRSADIERDAGLNAGEHMARLGDSIRRLEDAWSRAVTAWQGHAEMASGAIVPITDLPLRRWREVEVHMGDLGLGELGCEGPMSWSNEYVRRDLRVLTMQWTARGSMGLNTLPADVVRLPDRWRLAWLLGRHDVSGTARAELL